VGSGGGGPTTHDEPLRAMDRAAAALEVACGPREAALLGAAAGPSTAAEGGREVVGALAWLTLCTARTSFNFLSVGPP
jgi:hypothetical protein